MSTNYTKEELEHYRKLRTDAEIMELCHPGIHRRYPDRASKKIIALLRQKDLVMALVGLTGDTRGSTLRAIERLTSGKKPRTMSAEARAKISASQKKRWARLKQRRKAHAAKKTQ